jgi:hypothetical protein
LNRPGRRARVVEWGRRKTDRITVAGWSWQFDDVLGDIFFSAYGERHR